MQPLHPHDPPRVGPYRLRARIGEDACARTYLASAPGRPATALKVVRSEHTSDPDFRDAFARLVESARALHSPYVAPVLDADFQWAAPWVAVARPTGPTLAELVGDHGPLPAEALQPLALALAQGLADLHPAGHVHGGLRPDGVLVSPHSALIADPGFERAASEGEHPASAPHPAFAPPEGGTSTAADVFAWAATLCFAASGVAGPGGLDRVPAQLRGLVDACLKADPQLRPAATDLVDMLGGPAAPRPWPDGVRSVAARSGEAMHHLLTPPTAEPPPTPPERRPRRGRAIALAAGGAALLLTAAGTVWALRTPQGAEAEAEGGAEAPGGITEAGCLDGTGFPEPPGEITSLDAMNVAFSPDGDLLAVTSAHHGLTLWDWREGEEIARPTEEVHMDGRPVFAPVGCMVAAVVPHEPDGADEPVGGVTTFDVPSGDAVERPDPPLSGQVSAYPDRVPAFAPDGTQLMIALGGGYDEMGDQDTFALVDIETGETERTWGSERITDAAYTGDGRVVAAGSEGVTLWDPGTGENLRTESHATPHLLDPLPGTDEVVHVDGDHGHMVRWDLEQRTETDAPELGELAEDPYTVLTHVTVDPERQRAHVGWVTDEEGLSQRYLAQSSGAEYTNHGALWDLETGEDLMADQGEHQLARPLALHPDGDAIAAIAQNGDVNLVDADTLEIMHPLK